MNKIKGDILGIVLTYLSVFMYFGRFDTNILLKVFPIIVLSVASLVFYNKNQIAKTNLVYINKAPLGFKVLVLLISFAIVRTNLPTATDVGTLNNVMTFIMFITFSYQTFNYIHIKYHNDIKIIHTVIVGPFFIFALINILFWLLGFQGTDEGAGLGQSVSAAALGVSLNRVKFFFANGINSYSTLVGALLSIQLTYCFVLKNRNLLNYIITFVFLLTIILTDSRAAFGYAAGVSVFLWIIQNLKKVGFVKWLPLFLILGPLIMASLFPLLASVDTFSSISRSQEDFATGNSRFLIWSFAVSEFLVFRPIQIIGYGIYGHFGSGASLLWSNFFASYDNSEFVHPHNTVLSMLFDYGYLGLIIFIRYMFRIFKRLQKIWNLNRGLSIFCLSFLIYFVLISITESFFGFYYLDSIYLIFMFFFIANNINIKEYANQVK